MQEVLSDESGRVPVVECAAHHERPGLISIELASAVLLGWALIRRQADSPAPVLPIDLFRRPMSERTED